MRLRDLTSVLLLSSLLLGCGGTTPSPTRDNHPEESSRMAIYRGPPPRRLNSDPATKATTCRDLLAVNSRWIIDLFPADSVFFAPLQLSQFQCNTRT